MNYVTAASANVNYSIPTALQAAYTAQSQFHLELHNISTDQRVLYQAGVISGYVVPFASVAFPNDGAYILSVFYASGTDLDATTTLMKIASTHVQKITAVSTVAI